jgi:hypothetical protein
MCRHVPQHLPAVVQQTAVAREDNRSSSSYSHKGKVCSSSSSSTVRTPLARLLYLLQVHGSPSGKQ